MLIDGRAVHVAEQDDVINPAKGAPFATVPRGTKAHVDEAVAAASKAYRSWRKDESVRRAKLAECAKVLQARVQEIGGSLKTSFFTKTMATNPANLAYHPGALRYYKEKGLVK